MRPPDLAIASSLPAAFIGHLVRQFQLTVTGMDESTMELSSADDNLKTHGDQVIPDIQCTSKGKRLKSKVWDNMTRINMEDNNVGTECNHRKKRFKANPANDSNTANLMTMHKLAPSLDAIREAIDAYFIACALPFSQVESADFKYFTSVIAQQWKPSSRVTNQRDAMQYYNTLKLVVAKELQDAPGRICFTTDNWISEHNIDEYMCVTAHWID